LSNVITAAKNSYYNGLILNSNNKIKTTWNIIKMISGKRPNNTEVQFLYIKEKLTDNHQHFLNNYFLTIVGKINNKIKCDYSKEFDTGKH
jgi:hypothetical protein